MIKAADEVMSFECFVEFVAKKNVSALLTYYESPSDRQTDLVKNALNFDRIPKVFKMEADRVEINSLKMRAQNRERNACGVLRSRCACVECRPETVEIVHSFVSKCVEV